MGQIKRQPGEREPSGWGLFVAIAIAMVLVVVMLMMRANLPRDANGKLYSPLIEFILNGSK